MNNEIEGPLLTYDQMSDNDLLSCTNSLVTIMVVINHRNLPLSSMGLDALQKHDYDAMKEDMAVKGPLSSSLGGRSWGTRATAAVRRELDSVKGS